MKDNVVFFLSGLNTGGLEMYLLRFLEKKSCEFQKIYIICKKNYSGNLKNEYLKISNLNIELINLSFFNFLNYIKLLQLLNSQKINTVCDFTGDFSAFTLFISRIAGVKKRIVFYRGSEYQFEMTFLKKNYLLFNKFVLSKSATFFLSNSEAAFNKFQPSWKKNKSNFYKVIYNGVPDTKLLRTHIVERSLIGIRKSDFVIGHVGSFREAKNHKLILEIASVLVKKIPNVKFLLLGHGVEEGLKEDLIKNNLNEFFITPGIKNDLFNWLPLIDLFLFPSKNEGQPNALIEAMLSPLPIVASNIPSIYECTHYSMKKHLHSPNDSIAFINSIIELYNYGCSYDVNRVRSWAKEKFNPDIRFKEFLEVLT